MDDKRLKEIRARLEAATPGPWKEGKQYGGCIEVTSPSGHVCDVDEDFCGVSNGLNDLRLIAHAPTDIADLCDEVERLWAEVNKGNEMLRLYKDAMEAMPTKVSTLLAEVGQVRAALDP